MDNATTKGGALIGIKLVTSQLMTSHLADGMDEIPTIEIFKSILIQVMGIGPTMEVGSGRVFNPILITSILQNSQLM